MPDSAEQAMAQYANGNERAFALVYDALSVRLLRFLFRLTRNQARAEDLLQQTFLHIHRGRGSYVEGAPVLPWAFAIGRRLFLDELRKHKREVLVDEVPPQVSCPWSNALGRADESAASRETLRAVARILETMPETQRTAFELLKLEGQSVAEAAAILGLSPNALKLRAHRAYEAIREELGQREDLDVWRVE